jgi:hypothetical protein
MKKKGLFISIPKNASRTIQRMLNCALVDGNSQKVIAQVLEQNFISDNHCRASVMKERYGVHFDNSLKFCVIRDPYERAKSWYLYHKELGAKPYTILNFNNWILADCPHHWGFQNGTFYSKYSFPLNKRRDSNYNPIHQHIFVCDDKDNLIVDRILTMKTLQEDLAKISNELGYPINLEQKKVNTTKTKKSSVNFSKEAKKHLRKLLSKDFEIFNFENLFDMDDNL